MVRIDSQTSWTNNYKLEWIANPPPLSQLFTTSSVAPPPVSQPNVNCLTTYCSGSYTFTCNGNPTMVTVNHGLQATPSFAYGIINKSNQVFSDSFIVSIYSWSSTQIVFQVQRVDVNSTWANNYTLEWMTTRSISSLTSKTGSVLISCTANPTMVTITHGLNVIPTMASGIIYKGDYTSTTSDSFVISIFSQTSTEVVFQVQRIDTNSTWGNNYTLVWIVYSI